MKLLNKLNFKRLYFKRVQLDLSKHTDDVANFLLGEGADKEIVDIVNDLLKQKNVLWTQLEDGVAENEAKSVHERIAVLRERISFYANLAHVKKQEELNKSIRRFTLIVTVLTAIYTLSAVILLFRAI